MKQHQEVKRNASRIDTMAEDASKKKHELLLSIALYETRWLITDCKIKLLLTFVI